MRMKWTAYCVLIHRLMRASDSRSLNIRYETTCIARNSWHITSSNPVVDGIVSEKVSKDVGTNCFIGANIYRISQSQTSVIFTNIENFEVVFMASDCDVGKATTGVVHSKNKLGISPKLFPGGAASCNIDLLPPIVFIFGGSVAILAIFSTTSTRAATDCSPYHTSSGTSLNFSYTPQHV